MQQRDERDILQMVLSAEISKLEEDYLFLLVEPGMRRRMQNAERVSLLPRQRTPRNVRWNPLRRPQRFHVSHALLKVS